MEQGQQFARIRTRVPYGRPKRPPRLWGDRQASHHTVGSTRHDVHWKSPSGMTDESLRREDPDVLA
eukprot:11720936-Alexandrium_andersonii.AAC.1